MKSGQSKKYAAFVDLTKKVLAVPKSEILRCEAERPNHQTAFQPEHVDIAETSRHVVAEPKAWQRPKSESAERCAVMSFRPIICCDPYLVTKLTFQCCK